MRAVAVINRGQAIHCCALSAVVLGFIEAVMVNDIVDSVSPAIICIHLGQQSEDPLYVNCRYLPPGSVTRVISPISATA